MSTIEELFQYFNKKNIRVFTSKNPEVTCISGKFQSLIENVDEVKDNEIEVWQSFYNNRWTSFIKFVEKEDDYEENYQESYEDDYHPGELKEMEMDAWGYTGDPDEFEECGRPGY